MGTRKHHQKSKKGFRKTRSKKQRGGVTDQEEKDQFLLEAVTNNKVNKVTEALDAGANVNVHHQYDGNTALMEASECDPNMDLPAYQVEYVMKHKTEIVKMLLEKGADVNARNDDGETAFQIASKNECTETIKLLKQYIVAQTFPRHLERQEDRKNLEMVIREKPVKRKFGKHRLPPEIGHEMMKYLGGKRKTRRFKKSKRNTRKSKK